MLRCHHWPCMHGVMPSLAVPKGARALTSMFSLKTNRGDKHFTLLNDLHAVAGILAGF